MSPIKIKAGGFYYKFYNTLSLSLVEYSLGLAVNVQESSVDGQQARTDRRPVSVDTCTALPRAVTHGCECDVMHI